MNNPWLKTAAMIAGWLALGLVLSLQVYFDSGADWRHMYFAEVAGQQFARACMWALLTPFILQLREKLPLHRGGWVGGVAYHLAMSFVVMATFYFGRMAAFTWLEGSSFHGFWASSVRMFYIRNFIDMAFYWAVIAFGYSVELHRRYKREELKAAQLESRLVETELKALREQLRPHFFFNTLNTISVLVREQRNDQAVVLLARLSALLRMTLDRERTDEVTLGQEMEFLEPYLEIQQARFSDRLRVEILLAPETMAARIPYLILQPLVENAILHGVAPKSGPGCVTVRSRREGDNLYLEVTDDGPGFRASRASRPGVGLANTRERIEKIYGARGRLSLWSEPGMGAHVSIVIPCRI